MPFPDAAANGAAAGLAGRLPEIWRTHGEHMRRLHGGVLFPYAAASPELLSRVDEFLAAEQRPCSIVRVLVERRDIVEKALRSRALPPR